MIDADTGNIHLPNGFVITPALTLKEFRQSWFGRGVRFYNPDSQVFWCRLNIGTVETDPLEVGLHFDAEKLVSASLVADMSQVTQDNEQHWIDTKSFHDMLLRKDLGEPDTFTDTYGMDTPELGKAPNHLRPWGKAVSEFDYGGGDAYISITYHNDKAGDNKQ